MSDEHEHDYGTVVVFSPDGDLAGEGKACRYCGEDDPKNPVPMAGTIEDEDE